MRQLRFGGSRGDDKEETRQSESCFGSGSSVVQGLRQVGQMCDAVLSQVNSVVRIWRFRHLQWPCIQSVCSMESRPCKPSGPTMSNTLRICTYIKHGSLLSRAERKWAVGSGWQGGVWIFDLGWSDWLVPISEKSGACYAVAHGGTCTYRGGYTAIVPCLQ
ncbi:hypothetical protein LZ31DRAFT_161418 [Colletotrichum somersetense]|nr:hypothetical protein LZ31DRAFT_161418 [Colletotrichum somersetense]